jgi:DNA-binding NarL/FixJ family response regulator
LLAEGVDNAAMTERLGISPKTVRNDMVNALDKLGVHSRQQASGRLLRPRQTRLHHPGPRSTACSWRDAEHSS